MTVTTKKLTAEEFLSLDLPEDRGQRYELRSGEIVEITDMTGPKPEHSDLQTDLAFVLSLYRLHHPEFRPVVEPNLKVLADETRRPDLIVVLAPERGGRCVRNDLCYAGPPEIAIEVLSSRPMDDLLKKRTLYAKAGIPEYWILGPDESEAAFLSLEDGSYKETAVLREGFYETPRLPGFRLDVGALFRHDTQALAAALSSGTELEDGQAPRRKRSKGNGGARRK